MNFERLMSFFGIFILIFIAWCFSYHKKKLPLRIILTGLLLQFLLGVLLIWTTFGAYFFQASNTFVTKVISFSDEGASFVFGKGFQEHFFAFSVLPTIIFVSSLMACFFYMGVLQKIVGFFSKIMVKVMDVSGAESFAASVNVFVGQTEAPLVIKPYIKTMTNSEIMALMTGGMANVAGGVMAAYVSFGIDAGHLLTASFMSAPASLLIAKVMLPETEDSMTKGFIKVEIPVQDENILDAACRGASEGLSLALNVGAMLIAFVALAALINYGFSFLPYIFNEPVTVERILGYLFSPIAFIIGIPWEDCFKIGSLLGKKMFLNEFIAYMDLKEIRDQLSPRSVTIATYGLCGFANFASIAIQIGGIGSLVPERRKEFARFGLLSMIGGTLAALMTGAVAGVLIP